MTIEQFTAETGYIPQTTAEFDAIEHDRQVFKAPVKLFCQIWIKCYAAIKIREAQARMKNAIDVFELDALKIMVRNMTKKYQLAINAGI